MSPPPAPDPDPASAVAAALTVRFFDPRRRRYMAKVSAGGYFVSRGEELITTVLGSCVAACVRDAEAGVGGMNHFLLPGSLDPDPWGAAARYGIFAMEHLVNDLFKLGASRENLEFKLFGGASMSDTTIDVGRCNVEFVTRFVEAERHRVVAADLGGDHGRRLIYDPVSGRALLRRLRGREADSVRRAESSYRARVQRLPVDGGVELF